MARARPAKMARGRGRMARGRVARQARARKERARKARPPSEANPRRTRRTERPPIFLGGI